MNRRQLLQLLGWTGTTAAAPAILGSFNPDEQERLTRAIVTPNRVDEQVINHIETIHRYCKRQDDALGARAVLDTVLAQRDWFGAYWPTARLRFVTACSRSTAIYPAPLDSTFSILTTSITQCITANRPKRLHMRRVTPYSVSTH